MKSDLRSEVNAYLEESLVQSKLVKVNNFTEWWKSYLKKTKVDDRQYAAELPPHGGSKGLLDYQQEVISLLHDSAFKPNGKALVSLPTGAGKTFTALNAMFGALERGSRRVLWLAPQKLLLEQAEIELRRIWFTVPQSVGVNLEEKTSRRGRNEAVADVRFETIQKVLKTPSAGLIGEEPPDLIIVDEAHHLENNQFGSLVKSAISSGARVIGLTATPGRLLQREMSALKKIFDGTLITPSVLGSDPVTTLQKRGVFASVVCQQLRARNETQDERVIRRHLSKDGYKGQRKFSLMPSRLVGIVEALRGLDVDSRSLVFAFSTAHAIALCGAFNLCGVTADVVGSEFSASHNRGAIYRFRQGDSKVLVNVKYAAVGADFPFANAVFLSVPVGSEILFEQIVGRIARGPTVGGNAETWLFDFDDHINLYGGLKSYGRFINEWK